MCLRVCAHTCERHLCVSMHCCDKILQTTGKKNSCIQSPVSENSVHVLLVSGVGIWWGGGQSRTAQGKAVSEKESMRENRAHK